MPENLPGQPRHAEGSPRTESIFTDTLDFVALSPNRPDWAATPVLPWRSVDRSGSGEMSYMLHGYDVIESRLSRNLGQLTQRPRPYLIDMARSSMIAALSRRVAENHWHEVPKELLDDPVFQASRRGDALPVDLIGLLERHPDLGAVELAKLTTPFDWNGLASIDEAILRGLEFHKEKLTPSNKSARLYLGRLQESQNKPCATILIRKQLIAKFGDQEIIRRDSLVMDLLTDDTRHMASGLLEVVETSGEDYGGHSKVALGSDTDISQFVESQFVKPPIERSTSLYPVVRSYYIKDILRFGNAKNYKNPYTFRFDESN